MADTGSPRAYEVYRASLVGDFAVQFVGAGLALAVFYAAIVRRLASWADREVSEPAVAT